MANWIQKVIYMGSNVVPMLFIWALVWSLETKTLGMPLILCVIATAISILFWHCFNYNKKNLSSKEINVTGLYSNDKWIMAYVVAYLVPFLGIATQDNSVVILLVVVITVIILFVSVNFAVPNVLLFSFGYCFYTVETEDTGVKDYLLISKNRRLRNKQDVKCVIRVFEKILVDTRR